MAFTLYMLARPENKSKVERLTAEIDAFGRNRVPTFEDLDKFPWLEVSSEKRLCKGNADFDPSRTFGHTSPCLQRRELLIDHAKGASLSLMSCLFHSG